MIKSSKTVSKLFLGVILVILCYQGLWKWAILMTLIMKSMDVAISIFKGSPKMSMKKLNMITTPAMSWLFSTNSNKDHKDHAESPWFLESGGDSKSYRREFHQNWRDGKFEGMSSSELLKKSSEAEKMDWAAIQSFKKDWNHFYKESLNMKSSMENQMFSSGMKTYKPDTFSQLQEAFFGVFHIFLSPLITIFSKGILIQHFGAGWNLLPSSMESKYTKLHSKSIMSWIIGILSFTISLICLSKNMGFISKLMSSSSLMEVLWMTVPGVILLFICIPSLVMLYCEDHQPISTELALKTTASQWYWSYEYINKNKNSWPSGGDIESYGDYPSEDRLSYLSSMQEVQLPTNTEIINMISASDVMHSWTIPNLLLKADAIPGRINFLSMFIEGTDSKMKMFGQCSELCGANHSFMPISILLM